jgi:hypothetical protein
VVALVFAGCSSDSHQEVRLAGTVVTGPWPGPCVARSPCSRPAGNVELVFSRSGVTAARVTTDQRGRYVVMLERGSYRVTGPDFSRVSRLFPATVTLVEDTRRNFSIDVGIRR